VRRVFYKTVHAILPPSVRLPLRKAIRRAFPNYLTFLELLHDYLRPHTYVEIGVGHGRSLARARPGTLCVGIDPKPHLDAVRPAARIFELTSDDFFREHDLLAVLGGKRVDFAFIDGLHSFEFALRDFINLERFCDSGSVIAIHDCYPEDEASALARRPREFLDGVWKLIVCLREYRPDLSVVVVRVPPTGLGLVMHLDPASRVLGERYDAICRELADMGYDEVASSKADKLNLVAPNWTRVRSILAERPAASGA
jgi:hypothetical protein